MKTFSDLGLIREILGTTVVLTGSSSFRLAMVYKEC